MLKKNVRRIHEALELHEVETLVLLSMRCEVWQKPYGVEIGLRHNLSDLRARCLAPELAEKAPEFLLIELAVQVAIELATLNVRSLEVRAHYAPHGRALPTLCRSDAWHWP